MNGQVIQGLNINNMGSLNTAPPRSATPGSGAATPGSEANGDLSIQSMPSVYVAYLCAVVHFRLGYF